MRRTISTLAFLSMILGCDTNNDYTYVVEELMVLGVGMEPSELVFDLDLLYHLPADHFPNTRIEMKALVANPDSLGGQEAIRHIQWSIGDPPMEGTVPIVTTSSDLLFEGEMLYPALQGLGGVSGEFTPATLADILAEGPLQLPIVVTAVSDNDAARAVKLLTVRAAEDWGDDPNGNPSVEGLEMGGATWSESFLDNLGPGQTLTPPAVGRNTAIDVKVDTDDDASDGDVESTMYTTAGHIYWSASSMRRWNLTTPGEDFEPDRFSLYIVLRDLEGAQSWITVDQTLLY